MNTLCGHKVSIVAETPQTTRNKVRGILTAEEGQLVFVDTPGFHLSERKFNIHMSDLVFSALDETDVILYVIDGSREPGEEEQVLADTVKKFPEKTIIAVNKCDLEKNSSDDVKGFLRFEEMNMPVFEISALKQTGIEALKAKLFELAPEGEMMYPSEYYTDQTPEFRIAEIIREKALSRVREEVPHALYVEIADMEKDEEKDSLWVRAFLMVERESQKGILVGKKGSMIKAIRLGAQRELNKLFPYSVHLDLRVKVNPKWRRKDNLLNKLIQ